MRLRIAHCALLTFVSLPSAAQVSPPTVTPTSKAEQITAAIDMLTNIRVAVANTRKGKESATYKAISMRLAQCALFYGVLARRDNENETMYTNASQAFNIASGTLYPGPFENYKRDVLKAKEEMTKLHAEKDKLRQFYFVRNCRDWAKPEVGDVANAIAELTM